MTSPSFNYGQDVTLITRTVSGQDAFGNDVYAETQTVLTSVPVWPQGSTENVQGEEQVSTGLVALLPTGTDVTAVDAVLVDGTRYEVQGDPSTFTSPFTQMSSGVQVTLRRVTG